MRERNQKKPLSIRLLAEAFAFFAEKGLPADRSLRETFRSHKLRDEYRRAELAGKFYGIIRFLRPLASAMGKERFPSEQEIQEFSDAWNSWKKIYNGKEPAEQNPVTVRLKNYMRVRKLRESVPDWLDEFGVEQLGEEKWEQLIHVLNRDPLIFLRANTLQATKEKLVEALAQEELAAQVVNGTGAAVMVNGYHNVFATKAFHDGLFEVQDLSSQSVAPFLDAQPGMRVCDACAGSGGKTLHLAALMENRGRIVAMDISEKKLAELKTRCRKAGVHLAESRHIDSVRVLKRMENSFDRVLIDAPCSGSGVLRRNPEIRWRLSPEEITRLMSEQQQLLEQFSVLVKPGGKLVYATCSIFPCEGEQQAKQFLSANGNVWEAEEELRTDPVRDEGDGFYMIRLHKKV